MPELNPAVVYYRKSIGDDHDVEKYVVTTYAERHGFDIKLEYVDDDISGQKKDRPDFTKLMNAIMSDELRGFTVLVRDQERLSRGSLADLEEWHLQTDAGGVKTISCEDGREIKDDEITGIRAVIARGAAKRTGALLKNRKRADAAAGKPPTSGRYRPYGYTKNWESIIEEEADILREAARRLLAGETLHAIAKDFTGRRVMMHTGNSLTLAALSRMLRKPERAGLRVLGDITAKGTWPAIFPEDTFNKIQRLLDKNDAWYPTNDGRRAARKHLLTTILYCQCGQKMVVGSQLKKLRKRTYRYYTYRCAGRAHGGCGKVVTSMDAVNDYVLGKAYLALKEYVPQVTEAPASDKTEELIAQCEAKILETRQAYNDNLVPLADWIAVSNAQREKIKELRKVQASKDAPLPLSDADALLADETPIAKKTATIRRLWPVIEVLPAKRKGAVFHPDRLKFPE
ncbi:recombinase family protein [Labedaea rhizosphaerae]|uniref:DNA invertase Pin-like site-specific DNA recombinase n=1 Tax=Labedaea rhizosphaerae TaxID=598644 RepID=A0A4R6RXU6_LABRH|nr:recombinase family protein [Labedaea rhizosphaerae]TDP91823.1 DNA invertase Pin-like site-specific DNA recombinase [Labedaea rhizosphaerae]